MSHALNWFEIPVSDLDRATAFYEKVLGTTLRRETMGDIAMSILPYQAEGVGGSLIAHPMLKPAPNGTLVYLNVGDDLAPALARAEAAGATVVLPRTQITPEIGYIAIFRDCEGNQVGLHSPH